MELTPLTQKFVLHWGEMGARWGVNRTVGQIHALLYILGTPLHAEDIATLLGVARSNVSNSLKELQSWQLVRITHVRGDRRDHFETSTDVWALFRTIVQERKRREMDPTIDFLRNTVASDTFEHAPVDVQQRLEDTLKLMETLTAWSDEMLRLQPETLVKIMKMGAKIQSLVRPPPASP